MGSDSQRSDRGRSLVRAWIIASCVVAVGFPAPSVRSDSPSDLVGQPLPEIRTRPLVERHARSLLPRDVNPRDHLGHPLLVWVFATWCGNCRDMEPDLAEMHERFAPQGVRFLALSVEPRQTIHRRIHRHPVPWRVGQTTGHAVHQLNARSLPTYLVVDRRGVVQGARVGGSARVARWIRRRLEELVETR